MHEGREYGNIQNTRVTKCVYPNACGGKCEDEKVRVDWLGKRPINRLLYNAIILEAEECEVDSIAFLKK